MIRAAPLALVLTLAACFERPLDNSQVGVADERANASLIAQDDAQMANEARAGAKSMTPQEFANAASASDAFEIQSSQKALAKAQSDAIKNYARMMIADHGKSSGELKAAAAQAQPPATPANALEPGQQGDLALLDRSNGAAFDKAYVESQIAGHEATLETLRNYASQGGAPALQAFAAKTAPVVEGHLRMARELGGTIASGR